MQGGSLFLSKAIAEGLGVLRGSWWRMLGSATLQCSRRMHLKAYLIAKQAGVYNHEQGEWEGSGALRGSWWATFASATSRCSSAVRLSRRRHTACRSFSISRYVPARMNAAWLACRPSFSCRTLPVRIACGMAGLCAAANLGITSVANWNHE